jgi:hypothetical protein
MFTTKTSSSEEKLAPEFKSQLTRAQKELLDSFFGREGFYLETIRENDDVNLGTKLLYLERAVNEPPQIYLESLKKLCLTPEKASTIELIRALKVINDLYFNNLIKYYGIKNAVDHFFHGLGQIESSELKLAVKEHINLEISSLKTKANEDIADQISKRKLAEPTIPGNENLPILLDLPHIQRCPSVEYHFNADEWDRKRGSIRTWLLSLQALNIVNEIFTDTYSHETAHMFVSTLNTLAWSNITFSNPNVSKALNMLVNVRDYQFAKSISSLVAHQLDNQNNYDKLTQGSIRIYTSSITYVLDTMHKMGISINQNKFDKIVNNYTKSRYLNVLCADISRIPGGITQNEFDGLLDMTNSYDEIYRRMCATGRMEWRHPNPMDRESFLAIVEEVRNEQMAATHTLTNSKSRR